ncbi:hypothetical protein BDU57DRAFT_518285 [Ampelomyces quisqualis]|uniref:Protein kinase domain-containing protein n=1 Tax=Ampelomyces quisqualis TaxID=50730 RepID=A0A6A5QIS4_AMPQU|nr:hypothetical protein BDU57DRAFT_518285 [Ampelomyces quisqualis]
MSYAGLREDIKKSHPGIRFSIATKLVRRLFSALAWMHFNGIIHGRVCSENVLLRLTDEKIAHVLLVDYTTARSVPVELPEPMSDMIADGHSAMQLIEDCCDIWAFRNGPTLAAMGEDLMQKHARDALHKYQVVQRVHTAFYSTDCNSHESEKGIKLDRLLTQLASEWHSARDKQAQNRAEREVANMSKSKIEAKAQEWESANGPQVGVYKQYMVLSLGHSYLDSLADPFHFGRWDIKPSEICAKIREFGGELEEPWQTFDVCLTTPLVHGAGGFCAEDIMNWLASCCEVFPEWRKVLDLECQSHLRPNGVGVIPANALHNLRVALQAHGELPPSMSVMFNHIPHEMATPQQVEESFQVWYHIPSRMFNLTQLQRLATPARLAATISEGQIRCNNFVEVRGDPKVQGHYAPLALLEAFVEQLGLRMAQTPNFLSTIPSFDPSDFSQVPSGRIVLARPGLIGYGSMLRSGDQASFLFSRTNSKFIMPSAFIPTYFGDMKVLPKLPKNRNYNRPDHWSKFRTSEEHEASANLEKRRKLVALGSKASKLRHGRAHAPALSDIMEVDDSTLVQKLKERERVRSEARPPATRNADEISSRTATVDPKRARPEDEEAGSAPKICLPDISLSFIQRMEERNQAPSSGRPMPGNPTVAQNIGESSFSNTSFMKQNFHDPNQSFTVVDDDEGLQEDWAEVDRMLDEMPAEDEEPEVQGLTGYIFHDVPDDDEPATNPPSFTDKGKSKATAEAQAFFDAQAQNQRGGSSFSKSFRQSPKKTQDSPATPFMKKHRRNMSGLSNVTHSSDIMPATQPSSPTPQASPHTTPGQTEGMVRGFLTQASTRPGSAARPIPCGNPATRPPKFPAQIMNPNTSFGTSMPDTDPGMSFGDNMPPTQANSPQGAPQIGIDFPNVNMSFRSDMPPTEAGSPTAPANSVPKTRDYVNMERSFGSDMPRTEAGSPAGAPNLGHAFTTGTSFGSNMPPTQPNSPVNPVQNARPSHMSATQPHTPFDSNMPPTQPSVRRPNNASNSR